VDTVPAAVTLNVKDGTRQSLSLSLSQNLALALTLTLTLLNPNETVSSTPVLMVTLTQ